MRSLWTTTKNSPCWLQLEENPRQQKDQHGQKYINKNSFKKVVKQKEQIIQKI